MANYLRGHFLNEPLRDWDVSRPAPYFGFEIPDSPGNYWYVWFDAPIGYMASTQEWCDRQGEKFDDWWRSAADRNSSLHRQGHHLFPHAVLAGDAQSGRLQPAAAGSHPRLSDRRRREDVEVARGRSSARRRISKHLNPAYLRYYYASKLTPSVDDLDLNLDEFVAKVNSDLVGKVVNLASRTARFVARPGLSPALSDDGGLFAAAAAAGDEIAAAYEACDYNRAMRTIMVLADRANEYVDAAAAVEDRQTTRPSRPSCKTSAPWR